MFWSTSNYWCLHVLVKLLNNSGVEVSSALNSAACPNIGFYSTYTDSFYLGILAANITLAHLLQESYLWEAIGKMTQNLCPSNYILLSSWYTVMNETWPLSWMTDNLVRETEADNSHMSNMCYRKDIQAKAFWTEEIKTVCCVWIRREVHTGKAKK